MSFAYLPWYTGDYLRDTRHLTPQKHGVYLLLLAHCWDQKGPVPLDEQEAAGIANCRSADEIDALRYVLARYFVKMDDGWYNKRMTELVAYAEGIAAVRRRGGLEKARRQREAVRVAVQGAQAVLKQSSSSGPAGNPNPNPNPNLKLPQPMLPSGSPSENLQEDAPAADAQALDLAVEEANPKTYTVPPCPYQRIVDAYHELLAVAPRVEVLSEQRKRHIAARWRQVCADSKLDQAAGVEWFRDFFAFAGKSKFLTGQAKSRDGRLPFVASLDWLMGPEKFVHVYEGRYHR